MFAELTVVVDGAVEETFTVFDETVMNAYVGTVEDDAKDHGYPTEVYITYHEHDLYLDDGECSCVQYLTDHRPAYSFNIPSYERAAKDAIVDAVDNVRRGPESEYVNTPAGHYRREWVPIETMRAHFGYPTFRQFRAWQWKRDADGIVWYAQYS